MKQSYSAIRSWALLIMLGCFLIGNAQDTLVIGVGATKLAHVIKVTEFDVFYKTWDSLSGPDYRMDLNKLTAIRYQGGNITQLGIADSLKGAPKKTANAQTNMDSIALPDKSHTTFKTPDTIILLNGEVIAVKIVSENDREITYKKWNNPDGPVYRISVAHLAQVKRMQGKANRANVLDTLVLKTGRELTCQIEAVSDCSVQYDALRLRPGQSFANMPLAYVTMIKYANGGRYLVINHHPMQDPHMVMRNCQFTFQKQVPLAPFSLDKYNSYLRGSRACMITGFVMMGAGLTTTIAGAAILVNVYYDPATSPGFDMLITGLCVASLSAIPLAFSGVLKKKALLYKNGLVSISMPQPDFMLPTAQNNFEKGFGVRTGISF